jgi:chromosome partitioning protein
MKVIAISNQKGGVGKTTTAINLSAALTLLGQRVLLIDLDPQANTTSGIGLEANGEESLYPVLLGNADIRDKIQQSRIDLLSVIPAHMDLAGVEIELARSDDHLTRLRGYLQGLKPNDLFEYCILDTPPSLGVLMTSALASADEVLIPLQCEWFGLEGLAKIVHVIDQIRESGANPDIILEGIVMTMFDARTNLCRQVVEEVLNYFPKETYKTSIPRSIRIGEAPSHGKTIFEHDPNGLGSKSYLALAEEFLVRHAVYGSLLAKS